MKVVCVDQYTNVVSATQITVIAKFIIRTKIRHPCVSDDVSLKYLVFVQYGGLYFSAITSCKFPAGLYRKRNVFTEHIRRCPATLSRLVSLASRGNLPRNCA